MWLWWEQHDHQLELNIALLHYLKLLLCLIILWAIIQSFSAVFLHSTLTSCLLGSGNSAQIFLRWLHCRNIRKMERNLRAGHSLQQGAVEMEDIIYGWRVTFINMVLRAILVAETSKLFPWFYSSSPLGFSAGMIWPSQTGFRVPVNSARPWEIETIRTSPHRSTDPDTNHRLLNQVLIAGILFMNVQYQQGTKWK